MAYSRWPSKAARDASWPSGNSVPAELPENMRETIAALKNCLDDKRILPEISMEVVDDLLLKGKENF